MILFEECLQTYIRHHTENIISHDSSYYIKFIRASLIHVWKNRIQMIRFSRCPQVYISHDTGNTINLDWMDYITLFQASLNQILVSWQNLSRRCPLKSFGRGFAMATLPQIYCSSRFLLTVDTEQKSLIRKPEDASWGLRLLWILSCIFLIECTFRIQRFLSSSFRVCLYIFLVKVFSNSI